MVEKGRNLCEMALDLAMSLCGDRKLVMLNDHTAVSVPSEVIEKVKEKAGNPSTIEERMKFLRDWAVGMCKLTHPDWDTLPESEKEKCINTMLRVLAERAF